MDVRHAEEGYDVIANPTAPGPRGIMSFEVRGHSERGPVSMVGWGRVTFTKTTIYMLGGVRIYTKENE